jgi:hypothetical protein
MTKINVVTAKMELTRTTRYRVRRTFVAQTGDYFRLVHLGALRKPHLEPLQAAPLRRHTYWVAS